MFKRLKTLKQQGKYRIPEINDRKQSALRECTRQDVNSARSDPRIRAEAQPGEDTAAPPGCSPCSPRRGELALVKGATRGQRQRVRSTLRSTFPAPPPP